MSKKTPLHQWTHKDDGRVWLVKSVQPDMTSYGGFKWPKSGPVKPDRWSIEPTIESGGLFGWPWGIGVGEGKEVSAHDCWLVFAAKPEAVIWLENKAKVVPLPDGTLPEVILCGTMGQVMAATAGRRVEWIEHNSSGSSSATGYRGSSSATGYRGSSSATGYRGSSSATGVCGSSSATGVCGSSSATGDRGSSSATGDRGSSSATGYSGSSSATGYSGSSSATGKRGIAALSGEDGTIEVGPEALGAVTVPQFTWIVRKGAIVCQRVDGKVWVLFGDKVKVPDGTKVLVVKGKVRR